MKSSHNSLKVLAITHTEASSAPKFALTRLTDGKSLGSVSVASPYGGLVDGQPNSNLMRELRWYLEGFLDYPFHPETIHADHVLHALRLWGCQAFNALFDRRDAGELLSDCDILQIRSDDPQVLSWPWEALFNPQAGTYLAQRYRIERCVNKLADPPDLGSLPTDRVNILMVVARPFQGDVRYRSIARPLVELIHSGHIPARVDILRPPTFDQLDRHLRANTNKYHILHFDGHGAYGADQEPGSLQRYRGSQGRLIFESNIGEPDPKSASDLSALLHEHAVPVVVLNACRAAMLDERAEDAFASVATALLQSGMRSVVAMAYSLYVSGAQVFLPAFYGRLFETGKVAEAVLAGRQQMFFNKKRLSARGPYELEDWLLPVLYQQAGIDFDFVREARIESFESRLLEDTHRDKYDFIGRDGPILELERALHQQAPCILIQGLSGIGKTTLARGFLHWLDQTGGLDQSLWFDFRDIHTDELVINRTGEAFCGENFRAVPNKFELLAVALQKTRALMVWDNFESAAQNLTEEDRINLSRFLDSIHGTPSKVIMTSRSREDWIRPSLRFDLGLRGLDGEERWEYCEHILSELRLEAKVKRDDLQFSALMDQLNGHPLAMRVILPKLECMSPAAMQSALRNNLAELGLDERVEQGRLFATLRFVEQDLAEELRPLMSLVGLHEAYLNSDLLGEMANQVDQTRTRTQIDRLLTALEAAGIVRNIGNAIHEIHPLLTGYLRSRGPHSEPAQRAFVNVMARLADTLTHTEFRKKRIFFLMHGSNFYFAANLAAKLGMNHHFAALTQFLAHYAYEIRDLAEASRLQGELGLNRAGTDDSRGQAGAFHELGRIAAEQNNFATAQYWYSHSLAISEREKDKRTAALTYHQLGIIAEKERDFEKARGLYLNSLAISEQLGDEHGESLTYHQLGSVALEQREFATAREWYLKSLNIKKRWLDEQGAASSYHQLGRIAEEERDFATAQEWYLKSLAISKQHEDKQGVALAYHQLGNIATERKDFAAARERYLKSLAIYEQMGDEQGAAISYHQLGRIAEENEEFATAREWYLKSLAIKERLGNAHGASQTCLRLGTIALAQKDLTTARDWYLRSLSLEKQLDDQNGVAIASYQLGQVAQQDADFAAARAWYLKSLAIDERLENKRGTATDCSQLGIVAGLQGDFEESARWLVRSIDLFSQLSDEQEAALNTNNFMATYWRAPADYRQKLGEIWDENIRGDSLDSLTEEPVPPEAAPLGGNHRLEGIRHDTISGVFMEKAIPVPTPEPRSGVLSRLTPVWLQTLFLGIIVSFLRERSPAWLRHLAERLTISIASRQTPEA